jgi:predicted nucleotidyltransferase
MNVTIEEIKEKVVPILKEEGITKSSLFGSYVHGNMTEKSDIDILVDYPRGKGLFGFIGLQERLEKALGKKVDLVTFKGLHPLLKEQILSEQIPIL